MDATNFKLISNYCSNELAHTNYASAPNVARAHGSVWPINPDKITRVSASALASVRIRRFVPTLCNIHQICITHISLSISTCVQPAPPILDIDISRSLLSHDLCATPHGNITQSSNAVKSTEHPRKIGRSAPKCPERTCIATRCLCPPMAMCNMLRAQKLCM